MEIIGPILTVLAILLPKLLDAYQRQQQDTPERRREARDALLTSSDPAALDQLSLELERLQQQKAAGRDAPRQPPPPPRV